MELTYEQRARLGRIAVRRGWRCQQCGATLVTTGSAFKLVGSSAGFYVGLYCTNVDAPHPEGLDREVTTERLYGAETEELGIA